MGLRRRARPGPAVLVECFGALAKGDRRGPRTVPAASLGEAAAAIGLAACGSDDSTLTTAEFVEQGNAICADANPEISAIFGELASKGDSATPADLQAALDGMVARVGEQIDDIAALEHVVQIIPMRF